MTSKRKKLKKKLRKTTRKYAKADCKLAKLRVKAERLAYKLGIYT